MMSTHSTSTGTPRPITETLISSLFFLLPPIVTAASYYYRNFNHREKRNDETYLAQAQAIRRRMIPPRQSNFRVVAILVLDNKRVGDSHPHTIIGMNDEPTPFLGGSLCAERAAFARLTYEANAFHKRLQEVELRVQTVYIVTDSTTMAIPPGMLCREYMAGSSYTNHDTTRIVLQAGYDEDCGSTSAPIVLHTLKELYPYPTIYMKLPRNEQMIRGESLQQRQQQLLKEIELPPGLSSDNLTQLLQAARQKLQDDPFDELHPVRYAAAALVETHHHGLQVVSTAQRKGLEYGCTLDAVTQLVPLWNSNNVASVKLLVQVDQFGICHGPFAAARSFLVEHGYGETWVVVNWMETGQEDGGTASRNNDPDHLHLQVVQAHELAPYVPNFVDRKQSE